VRAEDLPKLREIAGWMMPASQAETGCLAYSYAEDLTDPGLIHVIERWVDDAALSTHFQTPHMARFNEALRDLKFVSLKVVAYAASEERVLMGG
jgi:quinol monooxygenase YgiN